MISFLFLMLLYFLPAILGRDKSDATGIFLLNLFLGWTLIGWVAAFIWAIASDRAHYVRSLVSGYKSKRISWLGLSSNSD